MAWRRVLFPYWNRNYSLFSLALETRGVVLLLTMTVKVKEKNNGSVYYAYCSINKL